MKDKVLKACFDFVNEKIRETEAAMATAREAQQDDTKSSAGDKYETTREMMTQEIENHLVQLSALHQQRIMLQSLDAEKSYSSAEAGSLVQTDRGTFFISISAGNVVAGSSKIICISPTSPIALSMMGKRANEYFMFRNIRYNISSIS